MGEMLYLAFFGSVICDKIITSGISLSVVFCTLRGGLSNSELRNSTIFGLYGRSSNVFFDVSFILGSCAFTGVSYILGSFVSDTVSREGIMSDLHIKYEILINAVLTSSPSYSAGVVVDDGFFMIDTLSVSG